VERNIMLNRLTHRRCLRPQLEERTCVTLLKTFYRDVRYEETINVKVCIVFVLNRKEYKCTI